MYMFLHILHFSYTHLYVLTHTYALIHTLICSYTHLYTQTHTYMFVHTYILTEDFIYSYTHLFTHKHSYTFLVLHTRIHILLCVPTHTYTLIHTLICSYTHSYTLPHTYMFLHILELLVSLINYESKQYIRHRNHPLTHYFEHSLNVEEKIMVKNT